MDLFGDKDPFASDDWGPNQLDPRNVLGGGGGLGDGHAVGQDLNDGIAFNLAAQQVLPAPPRVADIIDLCNDSDDDRSDLLDDGGRGPQLMDACITARRCPKFLERDAPLPQSIVYACAQQEMGRGGFLHWQCFIQFRSKQRFSAIKNICGDNTVHIEQRKGTPEQARDYCHKSETQVPDTWREKGLLRSPKKNHTDAIYQAIKDGAGTAELMEISFSSYSRCFKAVEKALDLQRKGLLPGQAGPRLRPTQFVQPRAELHWGATGTGKTRYCLQVADDEFKGSVFRKPADGAWWDGYEGEPCVLIDDFDGETPIGTLLQLLDGTGHAVKLPVKGGFVSITAKCFLITSNKSHRQWYPKATNAQLDALERRFTLIKEYSQLN